MKKEVTSCIMGEPCSMFEIMGEAVGKLGVNWHYKILASPPVVAYGQFFGGDGIILAWFYGLFFTDLVFGVANAVKAESFKRRYMERWVVKLVTYTICIAMVGTINDALKRSLGFNFPLLDIFMTFLLAGEVLSICDHLNALGCPVPAVLMRLATRIRKKAESKIDGILEEGKEGEK